MFFFPEKNDQWCCLNPRMVQGLNTEGELFIRPLAMDFPEDPKAQRGLKMNLMNLKPFPSISKRVLCCGWAGEVWGFVFIF